MFIVTRLQEMAHAGVLSLLPVISVFVGFAAAVPGIKRIVSGVEIFSCVREPKSAYYGIKEADEYGGDSQIHYPEGKSLPDKQGIDPYHHRCLNIRRLMFLPGG